MKTLKDLGLTEQDAVSEIEFMSGWDRFLQDNMNNLEYICYAAEYAKQVLSESLSSLDSIEKDIKNVYDEMEKLNVKIN